MILNQEDSALLIIDVQEKLLNAVFNKEIILKNSKILATVSELLNIPTVITEQYPKGLGETIAEIKSAVKTDCNFEKVDFNALTDKTLLKKLKQFKKKQIILFGIETHICVHQTASALIDYGFDVILAKDACGSRSEFEYNAAIEDMKSYGVNIKSTEMIIFELLKSAKHPNFKEIQALIK